jgi:hypothetical protein
MISACLTFTGSFIASLVWAKLIMMLDVSSPNAVGSITSALVSCLGVASVYLVVDLLTNGKRSSANFLHLVIQALTVSFIGTITISLGFFTILLLLGYIEIRNVSLEVAAAIILGSLLFASNFVAVVSLKTAVYSFGLGKNLNEN